MTEKIKISSGVKWESLVGYSRAVKAGNMIFIGGTAAADEDGKTIGIKDAYAQTRIILTKIDKTLKQMGSSLEDVVRTRIFVTDISKWEEIGRAHNEFFREIMPCCTMIEVRALINPDMLVEIEAEAVT
jgi:enamine deaminase RidA (YjgF/YER057c/UK114 family)